ncbi:MAG: VOC family protein [Deltaproteobacteria bacterium]|nr:VOC family protein [Deltaproteobacteria bacterium]
MPSNESIKIRDFFHLAIIKDMNKAMKHFWHEFGIGPWGIMELFKSETEKMTLYGEPAATIIKGAMTTVGPLNLVIDDPMGEPHPYVDVLKRGGGGHHMAFAVEDYEQACKEMKKKGYTEISKAEGIGETGDGAGTYFDTIENMGTVIEFDRMPKEFPLPDEIYPPSGEQTISSKIKLKGLVHVCIAVKDSEKTAKYYEEELGIGPWRIMTMNTEGVDVIYKGKEASITIKGASAMFGQTEVVLEQSLTSPSHLQDFIDEHGQGIHHLCFAVDDLDVATKEMHQLGYDTILSVSGFGPNGDGFATHFDTQENLGIIIELARVPTGFGGRSIPGENDS